MVTRDHRLTPTIAQLDTPPSIQQGYHSPPGVACIGRKFSKRVWKCVFHFMMSLFLLLLHKLISYSETSSRRVDPHSSLFAYHSVLSTRPFSSSLTSSYRVWGIQLADDVYGNNPPHIPSHTYGQESRTSSRNSSSFRSYRVFIA